MPFSPAGAVIRNAVDAAGVKRNVRHRRAPRAFAVKRHQRKLKVSCTCETIQVPGELRLTTEGVD